jgi:hypothetical protein
MGARMRALRLALPPLLIATSLAAQSPTSSSNSAPAAVAPARTAFFDAAALVGSRERFGIEQPIFRRWAIGLIATHTGTRGTVAPTTLCCEPPTGSAWRDNVWSLDLAVRNYPAALSFRDRRPQLTVYLGGFVGYDWGSLSYVYPLVLTPEGPIQGGERQIHRGWEPGAEVGVRLKPLDPLFVDVGGWFKLVTVDDPTQRIRSGQLDARLVLAVGVGW